MPRYCLDTSGLSNPLQTMPDDIHVTIWEKVKAVIQAGVFCYNVEIHKELQLINGSVGKCLMDCADGCLFEVGEADWDWKTYLEILEALKQKYKTCISEYNGNRKDTVGLNDISIIALAMTLNLPLISMESESVQ